MASPTVNTKADAQTDDSIRKDGSKTSSVSSLTDKKASVSVDERRVSTDDLVDEPPKPFRWTSWLLRQKYTPIDLDAISTRRSVYDDPVLAEHYMPRADYENIHRLDIGARWTYREEKVC
jgi:hypothetical protein